MPFDRSIATIFQNLFKIFTMKRKFAVGALLCASLLVLAIACKKYWKQEREDLASTITTIYERQGIEESDPTIFGDHVTKIEKISLKDVYLAQFQRDPQWGKGVGSRLDPSKDILRYSFDYSAIRMVEIPLITNFKEEAVYIYEYKGQYIFTKGKLEFLLNGYRRVCFTDVDGAPYYQFDLNDQDKIGNYVCTRDIPASDYFTQGLEVGRATPTCHQKFPSSFIKCFDCAMSECFNNWLCGLACSLKVHIALGCAAAAGVHCMGVGPNA